MALVGWAVGGGLLSHLTPNLFTIILFATYHPTTAMGNGLSMVPRPRRVILTQSAAPFVVSHDAAVICPTAGRGVRHATSFLTAFVGRVAKARIHMSSGRGDDGTVVLTMSSAVKRPRNCGLRVAPRGILLAKNDRTNIFCNVRAVRGTLPVLGSNGITTTLPTNAIASFPHFHCQKFVVSMNHRFFPIDCLGRVVSLVTLRGVGCFR